MVFFLISSRFAGPLIQQLREGLGEKADKVVFSTHCQNDLGLSTANSIAGAAHGARGLRRGPAQPLPLRALQSGAGMRACGHAGMRTCGHGRPHAGAQGTLLRTAAAGEEGPADAPA